MVIRMDLKDNFKMVHNAITQHQTDVLNLQEFMKRLLLFIYFFTLQGNFSMGKI